MGNLSLVFKVLLLEIILQGAYIHVDYFLFNRLGALDAITRNKGITEL